MINLNAELANLDCNARAANQKDQLSSLSAQSFTKQLLEEVSRSSASRQINMNTNQLSVENQSSQSLATRQSSVARSNVAMTPSTAAALATAPAPAAVPAAVSAAVPEPAAVSAAVPEPAAVSAAVPAPAAVSAVPAPAAVSTAAPANSVSEQPSNAGETADDAYWSQQPAAVQQLRNMDDLGARTALGAQLASEGYTIDVPIMVWGWDAGNVMQARQSYGYTWVPSALQSPVSAAPGITGPGITPYNPNNPPSGSIQVTA
jgi:hypothetical protein